MIRSIEVNEGTFEAIALAAKAKDVAPGEIVEWMVRVLSLQRDPAANKEIGGVAVWSVYEGVRTEGRFDPTTGRLVITSGPLSGRRFRSPSGAAMAVVKNVNPGRKSPHTNGYTFWRVAATGNAISTLRKPGP